MSQKSGLQRQVLALYRQILRAVREKPESHRQKIQDYARGQIELNARLNKKDIQTIEYFLNKGYRQLTTLQSADVVGLDIK